MSELPDYENLRSDENLQKLLEASASKAAPAAEPAAEASPEEAA